MKYRPKTIAGMWDSYKEYLESDAWNEKSDAWNEKSDAWNEKRNIMFKLRGRQCQQCGKNKVSAMHVHHTTYERVGQEKERDLVVLCDKCHDEEHELIKQKKPKFTSW